jgi:hypothetical protein
MLLNLRAQAPPSLLLDRRDLYLGNLVRAQRIVQPLIPLRSGIVIYHCIMERLLKEHETIVMGTCSSLTRGYATSKEPRLRKGLRCYSASFNAMPRLHLYVPKVGIKSYYHL